MPAINTANFPQYQPTVADHVNRAVAFIQNYAASSLWLGIGNPYPNNGAWESPYSDTNPPIPPVNASQLDNPIGYQLVSSVSLIYPSSTGTVQYGGTTWATSSTTNALANSAYFVFIQTLIVGSALPVGVEYREIGIFYNLQPFAQYAGNTSLLPNQVSSLGTLLLIDFRGPTMRYTDQTDQLYYVLEM